VRTAKASMQLSINAASKTQCVCMSVELDLAAQRLSYPLRIDDLW
jgi:hypothetical protein